MDEIVSLILACLLFVLLKLMPLWVAEHVGENNVVIYKQLFICKC